MKTHDVYKECDIWIGTKSYITFFILSVWKGAVAFRSMRWVKSWEPQVARLSQCEPTVLCIR